MRRSQVRGLAGNEFWRKRCCSTVETLSFPLPGLKVSVPDTGRYLDRPRLLSRIERSAADRAVLLVVSPAGMGKTSLVASWARRTRQRLAWYSVDYADRDAHQFLLGICAAIARVAPAASKRVLLASQQGESDIAALDRLAGSLAHQRLTLVLDDLDMLDDDKDVAAFLDHLVRFRAATMGVILLSRSVPALTFTQLASTDLISGLGRDELNFTAEEAADLLRIHQLATQNAAALASRSGGWAMGVLLLARSKQGTACFLTPEDSTLEDRLGKEVLDGLPPETRDFILRSALISPASIDDTNQLLGLSDAAQRYRDVHHRGLFIEQVHDHYRYHDLFRACCIRLFEQQDPSQLSRLLQDAANYWVGHGDVAHALGLLAEANHWPALSALLEREWEQLWSHCLSGSLAAYVHKLPVIHQSAGLLTLWGRVHVGQGNLDQAMITATRALTVAANDRDRVGARLLHADVLARVDRYDEALREADAILPAAIELADRQVIAQAREVRGRAALRLGLVPTGTAEVDAAIALYDEDGNTADVARLLQCATLLLADCGHCADAAAYLERAEALTWALNDTPAVIRTHLARAHILTLAGEFQAAHAEAQRAQIRATDREDVALSCHAAACLSGIAVELGDPNEALLHGDTACEQADLIKDSRALAEAYRGLLAARIARRQAGHVRALLEEGREACTLPSDLAWFDYYEGLQALRLGMRMKAATCLGEAATKLANLHRPHAAARAYLLLAEALAQEDQVGRTTNALNTLEQIVHEADCLAYLLPMARYARTVLRGDGARYRVRVRTRRLLTELAGACPGLQIVPG